jgi:Na+/H+-dicarboxylate symporter
MRNLALHWQIIIGMALGLIWGLLATQLGLVDFTIDWIKPFGKIFINLLKLIAVPLVLFSLISGIASLKDLAKLSRMGGKTVALYLFTTVLAVSIGLILVNLLNPGGSFPENQRDKFKQLYVEKVEAKAASALQVTDSSPLQPLVDMFPDNIFKAMTSNGNMLQVIVFALLLGISLIMIAPHRSQPVIDVVEGLNDAVVKMVELIMLTAPIGVFALLAGIIVDLAGDNPSEALSLLYALAYYSVVVVIGLGIMAFIVYPILLKSFTNYPPMQFFRAIAPAQLLAFSTSSSAATLPVTMDRVEHGVGVSSEVASFVLPIGATINMDGTSLYQAVAAVFIAGAFGIPLDFGDQLAIVLTATLASIGAAAVPGAGIVMLVIVLEQIGVPTEGVALIFAVDRILDMCRTTVNVTGDAMVATIIAHSEGELEIPIEEDRKS